MCVSKHCKDWEESHAFLFRILCFFSGLYSTRWLIPTAVVIFHERKYIKLYGHVGIGRNLISVHGQQNRAHFGAFVRIITVKEWIHVCFHFTHTSHEWSSFSSSVMWLCQRARIIKQKVWLSWDRHFYFPQFLLVVQGRVVDVFVEILVELRINRFLGMPLYAYDFFLAVFVFFSLSTTFLSVTVWFIWKIFELLSAFFPYNQATRDGLGRVLTMSGRCWHCFSLTKLNLPLTFRSGFLSVV